MGNKRYYWLKLHDDFFKSKRIKKLRKLGSDFVIIYLKMQLLSLQNNGVLEFSGIEDNFSSEIALDIDEDEDKVQLTISYLQSCGLLECTEDNEFFLPYVEKLTGSETQSTIRSRKCRENKALEVLSLQNALQCNTDATKCNREKEIEIDKDIDKKKSKKEKNSMSYFSSNSTNIFNYEHFVENVYPDTCYLKAHPQLEKSIRDWLEYKDSRDKKTGKYKTERGLSTTIKSIVSMSEQYGDDATIFYINKAISNEYIGLHFDGIERFKPSNNTKGKYDGMKFDFE